MGRATRAWTQGRQQALARRAAQVVSMAMIHTCIRVLDLDASISFYRDLFDLEEHSRHVFDSFTLCYLRSPGLPFELELTVNHGRAEAYQHGDGYGHLAVSVDDLEKALETYRARGGEAEIKRMEHDGKLLGKFFFAVDPDGYKIEVLARSGRFSDQP